MLTDAAYALTDANESEDYENLYFRQIEALCLFFFCSAPPAAIPQPSWN